MNRFCLVSLHWVHCVWSSGGICAQEKPWRHSKMFYLIVAKQMETRQVVEIDTRRKSGKSDCIALKSAMGKLFDPIEWVDRYRLLVGPYPQATRWLFYPQGIHQKCFSWCADICTDTVVPDSERRLNQAYILAEGFLHSAEILNTLRKPETRQLTECSILRQGSRFSVGS
jgi:hypothetical protein